MPTIPGEAAAAQGYLHTEWGSNRRKNIPLRKYRSREWLPTHGPKFVVDLGIEGRMTSNYFPLFVEIFIASFHFPSSGTDRDCTFPLRINGHDRLLDLAAAVSDGLSLIFGSSAAAD